MILTGTLAQASATAKVGSTIVYGMCLRYTRQWFGVASKYPTAASAWSHAAHKHPGEMPPSGAVVPVWFKYTNPAGHVAMRLSDGSVVTVNGFKVSRFSSIAAMTWAGFGAYLGWAEDLNGVRVYTPATPASNTTTPTATFTPTPIKEDEDTDIMDFWTTGQKEQDGGGAKVFAGGDRGQWIHISGPSFAARSKRDSTITATVVTSEELEALAQDAASLRALLR